MKQQEPRRVVAHPTQWGEEKSALVSEYGFLSPFIPTVEQLAIDTIELKRLNGELPDYYYEPLLVEQLLQETSTLLDRCLAYRREARELEIEAVRFAIEYKKNAEILDAEEAIDSAVSEKGILEVEERALEEAARLLNASGGNGPGLAAAALSKAKRSGARAQIQAQRLELLNQRRSILRRWEKVYMARHNSPGSAHNYQERMARIVSYLSEDLFEAHAKADALLLGIERIFGKGFSLPKLSEGSIDRLVTQVRAAARYIDVEVKQEVAYDLVIPICQPWRFGGKPLVDEVALGEYLKRPNAAPLEFNLEGVFFNQTRVRLKAVGLSFGSVWEPYSDTYSTTAENGNTVSSTGWSHSQTARLGKFRVRATVHTPMQVRSDGAGYYRPPVILGGVTVFGGASPVAMDAGMNCSNINPSGIWKIALESDAVYGGPRQAKISVKKDEREIVSDLKLHLRVVSRFESGVSAFSPLTTSRTRRIKAAK